MDLITDQENDGIPRGAKEVNGLKGFQHKRDEVFVGFGSTIQMTNALDPSLAHGYSLVASADFIKSYRILQSY